MITVQGKDTSSALRDWIKTEIRDCHKQSIELGKFFFSVSVGTIGVIVSLERLNENPGLDSRLIASLCVLFLSAGLALCMAVPKDFIVDGDTDLHKGASKNLSTSVIGKIALS